MDRSDRVLGVRLPVRHPTQPRVLAEALVEAGIAGERFRALQNGEAWEIPEHAG